MATCGIQSKTMLQLVNLAQQGDRKALSELVVLVSPIVHYQAKSFQGKGIELDDLCQEGMLGVLSAVKSFNAERGVAFKTYVNVCVKNRLLSFVRTQSVKSVFSTDTVSFDNDELADINNVDVEEQLINKEACEQIFNYINSQLSQRELQTLRLFLSGLSYEEISQGTGVSCKSVDNALQRVRQKLKKYNG